MTPSRRTFLALSATFALVLSACGGDGSDAGGPPVIQVAAAPSGGAAAASAESAGGGGAPADVATADDKMMADAMTMLAYIEYRLAAELPAFDSEAASWTLPDVTVTADQVRELAAVFAVTGEPREQPADWGGGWIVGPDDGSGPSLGVSGDSTAYWWYSPAWQDGAAVGCAMAEASEGGDAAGTSDAAVTSDTVATSDTAEPAVDVPAVECPEMEPPVGVPTADEAESKLGELLASLGEDPGEYVFETWADEWSASPSAYRLLDGVRSPLSITASYGENGELMYAGGYLADPQRDADYPRIGTAAGLERLQLGNDPAFAGWAAYSGAAVESVEGGSVEGGSDDVGSTGSGSSGDAVPDTMALVDPAVGVEPVEPIEPMVVDIVGVEEELVMVWSVDGPIHLLPGYSFLDADGGRYSVSAVPAEFLVPVEPVPVDTVPVDTVPLSDTAPPDTAASETVAPVDTAPVDTGTPGSDAATALDVAALVGLTEAEAVEVIETSGFVARVVERDGEVFPATMDYREDRVNLVVAAGLVTSATIG